MIGERRWRDEIYRRAVADGLATPRLRFHPLRKPSGGFRREWETRLAGARAAQGLPSDDEELPGLFDYFALANARIRLDRYEVIVVATASVGADYPGRLSHHDRGAPGTPRPAGVNGL